MSSLQVEQVEGDAYRVCLANADGEVCCTVSSLHLVDDKQRQLQAGLTRLQQLNPA